MADDDLCARLLLHDDDGGLLAFRGVRVQLTTSHSLLLLQSHTASTGTEPAQTAASAQRQSTRSSRLSFAASPSPSTPQIRIANNAGIRYGRRSVVVTRNIDECRVSVVRIADMHAPFTLAVSLTHAALCEDDSDVILRLCQRAGVSASEAVARAASAAQLVALVAFTCFVAPSGTQWTVASKLRRCLVLLSLPVRGAKADLFAQLERAVYSAEGGAAVGDAVHGAMMGSPAGVGRVAEQLRRHAERVEEHGSDVEEGDDDVHHRASASFSGPDDSSSAASVAAVPPTEDAAPAPEVDVASVISPDTLEQLRRMRSKPEYLFGNPALAFALLIRASRDIDRAEHSRSLRATGPEDGASMQSPVHRASIWSRRLHTGDAEADAEDAVERPRSAVRGMPAARPPLASRASGEAASPLPSTVRDARRMPELSKPLRRRHWVQLCSRFLVVLSDRYSAEQVFDALVESQAAVKVADMQVAGIERAPSGDISRLRSDSRGSRNDEPLTLTWSTSTEKVLRYELFEKYVNALSRPLMTPPAAWETLRDALELDSRELVVKVEEYVQLTLTLTLYAAFLASSKRDAPPSGDGDAPSADVVVLPVAAACELPLVAPDALGEQLQQISQAAAPGGRTGAQPLSDIAPQPSAAAIGVNDAAVSTTVGVHGSTWLSRGRAIRAFVDDDDAADEEVRRKELYDSASTYNSESGGETHAVHAHSSGHPHGLPAAATPRRTRVKRAIVRKMKRLASKLTDAASEAGAAEAEEEDRLFDAEIDGLVTGSVRSSALRSVARRAAARGPMSTSSLAPHHDDGDSAAEASDTSGEGGGSVSRSRAVSVASADDGGSISRTTSAPVAPPEQKLGTAARLRAGLASFVRASASTVRTLTGSKLAGEARSTDPSVTVSDDAFTYSNAAGALLNNGSAEVRILGTLIITDRNVYFHATRNEVLVMPLSTITDGVQLCRTHVRTLGMQLGQTSDNGLHIPRVQVRRVTLDPEADEDGPITPLQGMFMLSDALRGHAVNMNPTKVTRSRAVSAAAGGRSRAASASVTSAPAPPLPPASAAFADADAFMNDFVALPPPMRNRSAERATSDSSISDTRSRAASIDGDLRARSVGALVPRASVTLAFSKMKDLLLGRGEERTGGRRRVVQETLEELACAHRVAADNDRVLQELLAIYRRDPAHAANLLQPPSARTRAPAQPAGATGADAVDSAEAAASPAPTLLSSIASKMGLQTAHPSAAPAAVHVSSLPFDVSPQLLYAAAGGVSLTSLAALPMKMAAWKLHLKRDPVTEKLFHRRLHVLAALNVIRTRAILKATGACISDLYFCKRYLAGEDERAAGTIRHIMLMDDPAWIMRLALWLCHDQEVRRRRWETLGVFDRKRFQYEWGTLIDNVLYPLNRCRHILQYIVRWETPPLTAAVFLALILYAWHDMLPYTLPLLLFTFALSILAYGALDAPSKEWLARTLDRPRTAKGRTIIERLLNFRTSLGIGQLRMHKVNTYALKLRALLSWKDAPRSRFFVCLIVFLAVLTTVVPTRVLFAMVVLVQFTKPLRSPEKGVFGYALTRFWGGLPTPALSDPVYLPVREDTLELARAAATMPASGPPAQDAAGGAAIILCEAARSTVRQTTAFVMR